jgi:O-antigen/teichoic acid export membrane protein
MLGLNSAIIKLVPEFLERKQMDKVQGTLLFSFKIIIAASVGIAFIMVVFSNQLAPMMNLHSDTVLFTAALVAIMSPTTLFDCIYQGFQNMKKQFTTNFLGGLSKIVLAVVLIFSGMGDIGAMLALILSYVVTLFARLEKRMFNLSKHPIVDKPAIIKFSVSAFMVFICSTILNGSQYIVLSAMETTEAAGMMSISMRIPLVISTIAVIFFSALAPIVSGLSADRRPKSRQSYLVKLVFRYSLFLMVPISVLLMLFSKYTILFFATPEYLPATELLVVMTAATAISGICGLFLSNLYSIGQPKLYMTTQIISAAIYMALSIPMTYYFSAMGMAVAYLVSNIALLMMSFSCLRKYLTFNLPLSDIGRIAAGTFVSIAPILLVMPYIHNFTIAILASALAGGVYMLVLLPMNFYITEDLTVLDVIADKVPPARRPIMLARGMVAKFVDRSYKETSFPAAHAYG